MSDLFHTIAEAARPEKTASTPGPWAWRRFGDTYTLHADHGKRDTIIGAIPHGQMNYPVVAMSIEGRLQDIDPEHPNARLIASAPDLLEALEDVLHHHIEFGGLHNDIAIKVSEAIKKATNS